MTGRIGETGAVTTTSTKAPKLDPALAAAVDVARAALAAEVADTDFGDHLGAVADADRVVTHSFASTQAGYVGWRWTVTVVRAPRQKTVTVNEVALVPGADALVAPTWLPWKDRLSKDDLGPGQLHPRPVDDTRLVPGYLAGDEALDEAAARQQREVAREIGLGRELVLSVHGRDLAADRWYSGDGGPEAAIAKSAPARCGSCGFLVRIGGPLAQVFGACANASSPSDGLVVALEHGCGAHSSVVDEASREVATSAEHAFDTLTWDTFIESDLEPITR